MANDCDRAEIASNTAIITLARSRMAIKAVVKICDPAIQQSNTAFNAITRPSRAAFKAVANDCDTAVYISNAVDSEFVGVGKAKTESSGISNAGKNSDILYTSPFNLYKIY